MTKTVVMWAIVVVTVEIVVYCMELLCIAVCWRGVAVDTNVTVSV